MKCVTTQEEGKGKDVGIGERDHFERCQEFVKTCLYVNFKINIFAYYVQNFVFIFQLLTD